MNYPSTEGKHGTIYQIAEGIRVGQNQHGSWEVFLKREDVRKRKSFDKGEEGRTRAFQWAEGLALKLGLIEPPETDKSFKAVSQEWLQLNRNRWSVSTLERYAGIVKDYLTPALGHLPLAEINRVKVKRMLVEVGAIRSPKTVELVHAVVSGIFTEANDLGYTVENPAQGMLKKLLPPKRKRAKAPPDPFNKADLEVVLGESRRVLVAPFPLILQTMADSGMRLGEVLAMKPENLDVRNEVYKVDEGVRRGLYSLPKTGIRIIDMPGSLVKELSAHIVRLRREAMKQAGSVERLFPDIEQHNVRDALRRACRAAKVRTRTPHDLRHTYATLLLMDHYSPVYVQKQLGHHSITMTVDIYGHWIPGEGRKDLEKTLRCSIKSEHRRLMVVDADDFEV